MLLRNVRYLEVSVKRGFNVLCFETKIIISSLFFNNLTENIKLFSVIILVWVLIDNTSYIINIIYGKISFLVYKLYNMYSVGILVL